MGWIVRVETVGAWSDGHVYVLFAADLPTTNLRVHYALSLHSTHQFSKFHRPFLSGESSQLVPGSPETPMSSHNLFPQLEELRLIRASLVGLKDSSLLFPRLKKQLCSLSYQKNQAYNTMATAGPESISESEMHYAPPQPYQARCSVKSPGLTDLVRDPSSERCCAFSMYRCYP